MNLRQSAIKGVIWSAIEAWGGQAISFIVFSLLARLLNPETFGLIALAGLSIAFMQVFIDQGFGEAIVQRKDLETEHLDTAFWVSLGLGLALMAISIPAASIVAGFFKQPQLTSIIQWLSLGFLFSGLSSVQNAVLSRKLAFKSLSIRSLIAIASGGLVGVSMAFLGFGVWSLVGQQLTNGSVGVLVLWRASDWRPGFRFSLKHFRELFSFGVNILGFNILNFFNARSDDLLIGYFLGPLQLGYYTVAYRLLATMTGVLISTITKVTLPTFSRLQQEPERMRNAFYKVTEMSSLITFPIFMGVAALTPELIEVLFGKQWLPSAPVMQLLILIGPLQAILFYNSSVLTALGRPDLRLKIHLLNTLANVIGFFIAVKWGIVAVAATYTIRGYLIAPVSITAINKLIGLDLRSYLSRYRGSVSATAAMVGAMLGTRFLLKDIDNPYLIIGACSSIGCLVYLKSIQLVSPKLFHQSVDFVRLLMPKTKRA